MLSISNTLADAFSPSFRLRCSTVTFPTLGTKGLKHRMGISPLGSHRWQLATAKPQSGNWTPKLTVSLSELRLQLREPGTCVWGREHTSCAVGLVKGLTWMKTPDKVGIISSTLQMKGSKTKGNLTWTRNHPHPGVGKRTSPLSDKNYCTMQSGKPADKQAKTHIQ